MYTMAATATRAAADAVACVKCPAVFARVMVGRRPSVPAPGDTQDQERRGGREEGGGGGPVQVLLSFFF